MPNYNHNHNLPLCSISSRHTTQKLKLSSPSQFIVPTASSQVHTKNHALKKLTHHSTSRYITLMHGLRMMHLKTMFQCWICVGSNHLGWALHRCWWWSGRQGWNWHWGQGYNVHKCKVQHEASPRRTINQILKKKKVCFSSKRHFSVVGGLWEHRNMFLEISYVILTFEKF
jgi:hypothetical protein